MLWNRISGGVTPSNTSLKQLCCTCSSNWGSIVELRLDNGFEKNRLSVNCETPLLRSFPLDPVPTFLSITESIVEMIRLCQYPVDDYSQRLSEFFRLA